MNLYEKSEELARSYFLVQTQIDKEYWVRTGHHMEFNEALFRSIIVVADALNRGYKFVNENNEVKEVKINEEK